MYLSWTRTAGLTMICLCLMLMAGTIYAGVEGSKANDVRFYMTDGAAYTYHTTDDPNEEITTVQFKVAFDVAQSGYLQGAIIKFNYDPTRATLVDARAVDGWGTFEPVLTETPGNPTGVVFQMDPDPGESTVPISQTPTILAEFDFRIECQTSPIASPLTIEYGAGNTWVDDGLDVHYVTNSTRIDHGSVRPYQPTWALWLGDTYGHMEVPGALGTVIEVPIFMGGEFKMAYANMTFGYDVAKLKYVGLTDLDPSITSTSVDTATSGQVRVQCFTNEGVYGRHEFHGDVIANLNFRVMGSWQGSSAEIDAINPTDFTVAQDAGTCGIPFGVYLKEGCSVSIPAYQVALSTTFTGDGTLSQDDDIVAIKVRMNNNFPAGGRFKSIITNLFLGTNLEKDGNLTYGDVDFGAIANDGSNGQEVSVWKDTNFSCMQMTDTARDMVGFNLEKSSTFVEPTTFDGRFYPITYQVPFDSDTSYSTRVKDTTGRVTLTRAASRVTWDTVQVEYIMGEYYCPSASGGSGLVSQSYYTRSNFDLHDFRVKIVVSGDHSIYDIALEPGVEIEELDSTSLKWAIVKSGTGWTDQEATTTRVKFATFTYAYWAQNRMLQLSGPGNGYWVTKSSTVSFRHAADSGYYMNNTSDDDQYEVSVGGSLTSQWWVSRDIDPDPDPDPLNWLAGPDGLPTEYALLQNYPNPFNPTTAFWYALPEGAWVEVSVYNITGQKVATLSEGWREAGFYNATWDGSDVASGVYFYRIVTDKFTESKKMILLK
jgi:hypothetical protein